MPIKFSTIKTFEELDEILRELGYKPKSIGEPEKEEGLYHQLSVYVRGEDEVKVHQKYFDEEDIHELVPLAKRTIGYEGSLDGLGELQEKKLDQ